MPPPTTPALVDPRRRRRRRLLYAALALVAVLLAAAIAATASPWPAALLIRLFFDRGAERMSTALQPHVPTTVAAWLDESYDPTDGDARLDVYAPQGLAVDERLPTIVWSHGGAYLSGAKEHIGNYARILASRGFTVVCVGYTVAPEGRYPLPLRQVNAALAHLIRQADRLPIDSTRVVLAGDSAGAHLSAQLALAISDGDYAQRLGIKPALSRQQLVGLLLHCGPYDVPGAAGNEGTSRFLDLVMWAYSGRHDYRDDVQFGLINILDHATPAFPPALISAGNADPLLPHSLALAAKLQQLGVTVDTLFFPADHQPPLGHEYQFDLNTDAGRLALERSVAFLTACTSRRP